MLLTRERPLTPDRSPWTLLLWVSALGLLFGLVNFGEIAEDSLRIARNNLHRTPASGDIVFVAIDDRSLHKVGNWPWPRSVDGDLVDKAESAGAKGIAFDINFAFPSADAKEDEAFADALKRSGKVHLAARARTGQDGKAINSPALPLFARNSQPAVISAQYNFQNAVWRLPYGLTLEGQPVPSLSSVLSGVAGATGDHYRLDYSIDVRSIPTYSAVDLLDGKIPAGALNGKQVLIGTATDAIGDQFFLPGYGRGFGAQAQIIGAETLKRGRPLDLGWFPAFAFAIAIAALALAQRPGTARPVILSTAIVLLLAVPLALERNLIFADIVPGLFVLAVISGTLAWQRMRRRGFFNAVSGLPNLNALNAYRPGRRKAIVAARILNFEDALATLPQGQEQQLVEQIVSRLTVGDSDRAIYQGDGGIFAWFADPRAPFGNHLEALHVLFRNPARVGKLSVDLAVTFGVEIGSSRSPANRLASALVAADEAARGGLKWRYHDPETLQDATWRLSMLSQLDDAIDRGEVWLAYQPKLDLNSRRIIGAEALARWTHPEKGPIAASEFVAAAEQHNRITKLTDFVLEEAIRRAADINRRGPGDFEVAVNMSACLMSDSQFPLRVEAMLVEHRLAPSNLTLELTETAALASNGEGLAIINRLYDLGIQISIDDYGTGMSTLDYLKRIPANEIKIDQSFIKGIAESRSDRLMVQSTIELAHSLGRRVVAEGVEAHPVIDLLAELRCDIAQGYAIGRPMSFESLTRRIAADRKRRVA